MSAYQKIVDELRLAHVSIEETELYEACERAGLQIIIKEKDRGDGRKAHYGDGVQPWDTALSEGWGAAGAALCVLRYLRRSKAPEHSRESARVYFRWMREHAAEERGEAPRRDDVAYGDWNRTLWRLVGSVLTLDELFNAIGADKGELAEELRRHVAWQTRR